MTDIVTDLRRRVRDAGTNLMLEPLRTEDARALLAQYDAMVEDKRRLMEIADDLSAQNTALNRILNGVAEAQNKGLDVVVRFDANRPDKTHIEYL